MMATTHALVGLLLASVAAFITPEVLPAAAAAAVAGSVFPDLDLYAEHRKTLHFPVYYSLAALTAAGLTALAPTVATVAAAFFLSGAAIHSVMDAFGGGLELRPWEGVSERAVYDHYRGRWIRPRRWITYDGAPSDLALAGVLAAPSLAVYGKYELVRALVVGLVGVSVGYALVRKQLVSIAEWLVARVPDHHLARLPERFLEDVR